MKNWRRWLGAAVAALLLYGVITSPEKSAANVQVGVSKLGEAADRLATFAGDVIK